MSGFNIQKPPLLFSLTFIVSLSVLIVLLIWSIRVNFACLLKLLLGCLKCMDVAIAFELLQLALFCGCLGGC